MSYLDGNDIVRAPTLPASGGLRRRHSLPSGTLLKQASLTADQDDAANNDNSSAPEQDTCCEPRDQTSGALWHRSSVAADADSSTCLIDADSSSSGNNNDSSSSSHPPLSEEAPAGARTAKAGAQAGWFRSFGISRAGRGGTSPPPAASANAAASAAATATSSSATAAPGGEGNDGSEEPADGVVHAFAAAGGAQGPSVKQLLPVVAAQLPQAASAVADQIMSRVKPGSRPRTKSE